jgi:hypothetical protein
MFIYFGRDYHSSSVGVRLVEVTCDKCGYEYFYRLARIGLGSGHAPYGIGGDRASRSAQEEAQRQMVRRLAEESELVPCPECQWVNDALISGYRRSRYLGMRTLAWGLAILGAVVAGIGACIVASDNGLDSGAVVSFLIGAAVVTSAVVGLTFGLRELLRKAIRPNQNYPIPSRLPPGTPPPLIRNSATGALERAGPRAQDNGEAGDWIDFQVGRSALPLLCCGCLSPAPQSSYERPVRRAVNLSVPMCRPCARQWRGRQWLGAFAALGLAALVGLPALLALGLDEIVVWVVAISVGIIVPIIGAMVAGRLACPVRVKVVDGARGVARLWFRNEDYRRQAVGGTV